MPWLPEFTRRKKIIILGDKLDEDLINFPLYVKIDDADIGNVCRPDGYDIRFADHLGNLLKYEIEDFQVVDGNAQGSFWVKINIFKILPETYFYVYYGNLSASDESDAENVWTRYRGVWHMSSDGVNIYDSTENSHDGVKFALDRPLDVVGNVNIAQRFDGVDDVITVSFANASRPISFECWIRAFAQVDSTIIQAAVSDNNFLIYTKDGDKIQFKVSPTDEFGFQQVVN